MLRKRLPEKFSGSLFSTLAKQVRSEQFPSAGKLMLLFNLYASSPGNSYFQVAFSSASLPANRTTFALPGPARWYRA